MISVPLRPMHIFGYGRVSTDKQAISIDLQRELVENAFKQLKALGRIPANAVFMWLHDEAVSATVGFYSRPSGEAIGLMCKAGDMILAACFDRICRSTMDFCEILEIVNREKIVLNVLDFGIDTSTPVGQLVGKVMACFKEYDRQEIARRTKEAMLYRRANGIPFTSTPWCGYQIAHKFIDGRKVKVFKPCPDSRRIALYIVDQIDNHGQSRRGLVKKLWNEGMRHPTGRYRGKRLNYDWIANAYLAAKADFPCCSMADYDPKKAKRMSCFGKDFEHFADPPTDDEVVLDAIVLADDE